MTTGATGRLDDLGAMVAARLAAAAAPGATVCLLVDGDAVVDHGVGHRDPGAAEPLGAEERFSLYSITKIVLAVAALRLVEQGRLELDAPIRAILPEAAAELEPAVTLRRLLNHTAGVPDYGAMSEYGADLKADPGAPWSPTEFLARTLPRGPLFPPGEGWAYSNIGFLLVRLAIERATGRGLGAALAGLVFRPLGLRRTAVAATLAEVADLSPGWSAALDDDGRLHDIARRFHPGWVSHGLVVSTAAEVARIVDGLVGGALLAPATLAQMLDAVVVPVDHPLIVDPGYGLGLMIDRGSPFGAVAGHGGEGPGFSTAAFVFPDVAGRRVTSVALANRDRPDLGLGIAFALAHGVPADFVWESGVGSRESGVEGRRRRPVPLGSTPAPMPRRTGGHRVDLTPDGPRRTRRADRTSRQKPPARPKAIRRHLHVGSTSCSVRAATVPRWRPGAPGEVRARRRSRHRGRRF